MSEPYQLPEYFGYLHAAYRQKRRLARNWLGVAPLVDVALLLFALYAASASFVLQPGIPLELPAAPFEAGASYDGLVVTIAQEGMVFFRDERVPLEGLRLAFAQAVHEDPDVKLLIEADQRVTQGILVQTYNLAMDAGIKEVVLATRLPPTLAPAP